MSQTVVLDESPYVPGEWTCDKCNFRLNKRLLRAIDMAIGIDHGAVSEPCPNDGTLLRPLTWRESDTESREAIQRLFKSLERAQARIDALEAAWPDNEYPMPAELVDSDE